MEFNNYYSPVQPGHPPPHVGNQQQHGGPQMQQQQPPPGSQMMHNQMPPQNIRQAMPQNHHQQQQQQQQQQMQNQQHLGHHSPQLAPQQQQQHPNYHPSPHSQMSHSGSPHPQQQPQQQQQPHHNSQQSMAGPPPQSSGISSQPVHMHAPSPHHHGGPPQMHIQQPQQLNQMVRPPMGPSVMATHQIQSNMQQQQPALQQQPIIHQPGPPHIYEFGPLRQSNMHHHPPQQNHHPHPQHPHHHPHQQHPHQAPMIHHPHVQQPGGMGRNSPYFPNILQTEIRVIELNRRLQCRPIFPRHQITPVPNINFDESLWWEKFATEFFEDDATLTLIVQEDKPAEYTIGRTLIPRFFRTYFDGGVTDLSINLRNPREAYINPPMITLDCDQTSIITNNINKYPPIGPNQGVVVHTEGHLVLEFVSNNFDTLTIKSWKFITRGCREYIDRSLTAMNLSSNFLIEPSTRHGLTKNTMSYLKMCMIMEPMQDLMFQNKATKTDPRSCLRKYLFDKYKHRSTDDNRSATNKRRKRKPSAAPPAMAGGPATNKKSKAAMNNSMGPGALNHSAIMSPSNTAPGGFSLATQDVMVVGEPTMMGGDFGDDNERMITRLENTQYDPTASMASNNEESDIINTSAGNDEANCLENSISNNVDLAVDNRTLSPSSLIHSRQPQQLQPQQQQPQQQPLLQPQQPPVMQLQDQPPPPQQQAPSSQENDAQPQQPKLEEACAPIDVPSMGQQLLESNNTAVTDPSLPPTQPQPSDQLNSIEQNEVQKSEDTAPIPPQTTTTNISSSSSSSSTKTTSTTTTTDTNTSSDAANTVASNANTTTKSETTNNNAAEVVAVNSEPDQSAKPKDDEIKLESNNDIKIKNNFDDSNENSMIGTNSIDRIENHANSITPLNEESDSNSQLTCSNATTGAAAMEQQQPVDNGVA